MATRVVQAERRYDSVYDPVYTTGGQRPIPVNKALYRTRDAMTHKHTAGVSGSTRFLYSRRPIVPFMHSVPPEVLLARPQAAAVGDASTSGGTAPVKVPADYARVDGKSDMGTQTVGLDVGSVCEVFSRLCSGWFTPLLSSWPY